MRRWGLRTTWRRRLPTGSNRHASVDIYALAVIAYEMLTGRLPYLADSPLAVLLAHVNQPLPPAASSTPSCRPRSKLCFTGRSRKTRKPAMGLPASSSGFDGGSSRVNRLHGRPRSPSARGRRTGRHASPSLTGRCSTRPSTVRCRLSSRQPLAQRPARGAPVPGGVATTRRQRPAPHLLLPAVLRAGLRATIARSWRWCFCRSRQEVC